MIKRLAAVLAGLFAISIPVLFTIGQGFLGRHEGPGQITQIARPKQVVADTTSRVEAAAEEVGSHDSKQILFGDLHVHTTFSFDAFMISLPLGPSEGAHPPADACDFARYCSALDFWSINDHAEQITPENWDETVDSIRQCNEVSGDPANPDTVAFLGWEWTDVGSTPGDHYGHKNVVLRDTEDDRIPTRPIAAASTLRRTQGSLRAHPVAFGAVLAAAGEPRLHDFARYLEERRVLEECDSDTNVRDLPEDCLETAETPADLQRKLDEWGHESIVIPHGTSWGFYTPPGSDWRKQLSAEMHDPKRQTLLEIYSGHGNSDEYRDWRAVTFDAAGRASCPEPSADYLPTCWQAGEIIRSRCLAAGEAAPECDQRAVAARQHAVDAGTQAHLSVPGSEVEDWLDAGQCRDCAEPAFNYRPAGAAQYIMALGDFSDPLQPRRFRFGFMSSSDNHFARPGTGYKENIRLGFTESRSRRGVDAGILADVITPPREEPVARSRPVDSDRMVSAGFAAFELERQASFFMTGGLIAAHSTGRARDQIWDSFARREVYGTSGPRILLWFDLINPPGTRATALPMGSEAVMADAPIFRARAVGSFEQLPGCPGYALDNLSPGRVEQVCKNECYNPSDQRRLISRIEVVRIRPQQHEGEAIASLIEDPWRVFDCEPDSGGCAVTFSDPDYASAGRDHLYYVRAIEEPTQVINAQNLRCQASGDDTCAAVDPCSDQDDLCLGTAEPKAWSSPIFIDWGVREQQAAR